MKQVQMEKRKRSKYQPHKIKLRSDMQKESTGQGMSTFSFRYSRQGGGQGLYLVSYSSKTKELLFSHATKGQMKGPMHEEVKKRLSILEEKKLKRHIIENGFFEAASGYPSDAGHNYFKYTLTVIMDHKTHTVSWTDVPTIVPFGLFRITQKMENLVHIKPQSVRDKLSKNS